MDNNVAHSKPIFHFFSMILVILQRMQCRVLGSFEVSWTLEMGWRIYKIWDALHNLIPFVQFKKRKTHHGGVLLLVKLQALT